MIRELSCHIAHGLESANERYFWSGQGLDKSILVSSSGMVMRKDTTWIAGSCWNLSGDVRHAPPAEAHLRNFVVKMFRSDHSYSVPLSFILITSVIVAGLQFTARNERYGCYDFL